MYADQDERSLLFAMLRFCCTTRPLLIFLTPTGWQGMASPGHNNRIEATWGSVKVTSRGRRQFGVRCARRGGALLWLALIHSTGLCCVSVSGGIKSITRPPNCGPIHPVTLAEPQNESGYWCCGLYMALEMEKEPKEEACKEL